MHSAVGGEERTRVVVVLGSVLALSGADTATVGASATQLRHALHISNTDVGLLVAVTSLVAAAASLPFGVVADRLARTRILGAAVALWGVAMVWSATVSSFGGLLEARLALGLVTAAAGPIVASLIGDYFPSAERGRIYGYLLTGELLGAGIGFSVSGDLAAVSWRAAFLVLAVPAAFLARAVLRLDEPARGSRSPLLAATASWAPGAAPSPAAGHSDPTVLRGPTGQPAAPYDGSPTAPAATFASGADAGDPPETMAQRLARQRDVGVDDDKVIGEALAGLGTVAACRYVLSIRTNVVLIAASACGYFYLSGVETFGVELVRSQYGINQAAANALLLVLGVGAVLGVLLAGRLSDHLLGRGMLEARVVVTAGAALLAVVVFIPALVTRSALSALAYLFFAALALAAQNPPIDAARLDIVPSALWGRAEGVRTALRTGAQSLAPVLFGFSADHVFGGGRHGLQLTFLVMLVPLGANAVLLFRARRTYAGDVATAAAAQQASGEAERSQA